MTSGTPKNPLGLYVGRRADFPGIIIPRITPSQPIPVGMMQSRATPLVIPPSGALWDLTTYLRSVPVEEFLGIISRLSWARITESEQFQRIISRRSQPGNTLREYQLAFLVKFLLEGCTEAQTRNWKVQTSDQRLSLVEELANLVSQVVCRADEMAYEGSVDDGFAVVFRVANQQFIDFDLLGKLYARAVLLYQQCARQEEQNQGIRLSAVLQEEVGLTLEQALFITYGFLATLGTSRREQFVERSFMTNSRDFPGLTQELMDRFFDWLAVDAASFREFGLQDRFQAREGYDLYNFNPLMSRPIVRMNDGRYCVPISSYFLKRAATGVYFDIVGSSKNKRAGNVIGKALEEYVRVLIEDLPRFGPLLPPIEPTRGAESCEWVLNDPSCAVVIECKCTSLLQDARTTGDRAAIKKSLARERGGVVGGIVQLVKTARLIRQGRYSAVDKDQGMILLLVTLGDIYFANSSYVRGIIEEALAEKGGSLDGFEYQVCPIGDFEELCRLASATGDDLGTLLQRKVSNPEHREWDIGVWSQAVCPKGATGSLPSHDRVREDGFRDMLERFRSAPA